MSSSSSSSASSQRPLPRPGAQPLLTVSDPVLGHSCEGVGTARAAASVANTPASTHSSNGNSPTVLANNNTSSSSAPATGLVCYVPSPTPTRSARCAAGGTASSQNSENSDSDSLRASASRLRRICNSTVRGDRDLGRNVLPHTGAAAQNTTQPPPVLASPVVPSSSTPFSASLSTGDVNETAAQLPTTELELQLQSQSQRSSASAGGSLRSALAYSTVSTVLLSVVVFAAIFLLSAVTSALTSLVFFALSSLAGTSSVVDAPSRGIVRVSSAASTTSTSSLRARLRALSLGMPKHSNPLTSEKTTPTPRCKTMPWGFARAMSVA
ncbi:hypothetical protein BC567DRAFT_214120 [Phyllosticta citribraziliensis]